MGDVVGIKQARMSDEQREIYLWRRYTEAKCAADESHRIGDYVSASKAWDEWHNAYCPISK
jgi:hypothetical protein